MFKVFVTDVIVSKGYEDNPALKYSGENDCCVQFRVGEKVYDPNAENNTRWTNHTVKAFGAVCERIKKMKLKEGSFINISGKLTEEVWPDPKTKEKKSARVIILDDIEYAFGGGKKSAIDSQSSKNSSESAGAEQQGGTPEDTANFEGYKSLGDDFFGND